MINFTDCTFLIPYRKGSQDRENNLVEILKYLNTFFYTNIMLVEQINKNDSTETEQKIKNFLNLKITYKKYFPENECFHKTKLYNLGLKDINTDIVIPYDNDILIPINQLTLARENLLSGYDYCYPFNQNYIEITKRLPKQRLDLLNTYNFDEYKKQASEYTKNLLNSGIKKGPPGLIRNCPPGGCILIQKKVYIEMGMENEEFCGYGPEDVERKNRLQKLGYSGNSILGDLFHIEHDHSDNDRRISTKHNNQIFSKVELMNKNEVILYYKEKTKNEIT